MPFRIIALAMTRSFRATAIIATLCGFPLSFNRCAKASEPGCGRRRRGSPGTGWPASCSCRRRCGACPSFSRCRERRGQTGQCGNLAAGDHSELGHFGEQGRGRDETDPRDRLRGDRGPVKGQAGYCDPPYLLMHIGDLAFQKRLMFVDKAVEHPVQPLPLPGLALVLQPLFASTNWALIATLARRSRMADSGDTRRI